MKEYFVKFWTSNQKLAGARICAESNLQAMDIIRSSYAIDHVICANDVSEPTLPAPRRQMPEYNCETGEFSDCPLEFSVNSPYNQMAFAEDYNDYNDDDYDDCELEDWELDDI